MDTHVKTILSSFITVNPQGHGFVTRCKDMGMGLEDRKIHLPVKLSKNKNRIKDMGMGLAKIETKPMSWKSGRLELF